MEESSIHDWKIYTEALLPKNFLKSLKNDKLVDVAKTFMGNASRFIILTEFPNFIAILATHLHNAEVAAWIKIEGKYPPDSWGKQEEAQQLKIAYVRGEAAPPISLMIGSVKSHEVYVAGGQHIKEGYESLMQTQLVSCWTAFETLAGDLWTAAMNYRPAGLAAIVGTPTRISRLAGDTKKQQEEVRDDEEPQQAPGDDAVIKLSALAEVTEGSYDLHDKMGTLLRARFNFTTLRGIREAFSRAFNEKEKKARMERLDKALASNWFDTLSVIRNVIVHKAGIADSEYVKRIKTIPMAPQLKYGQKLELNGKLCSDLVTNVLTASAEIVSSVDSWLTATARAHDSSSPEEV